MYLANIIVLFRMPHSTFQFILSGAIKLDAEMERLPEYCKVALFNSLFCTNICSNNFDNFVATNVRGRVNRF